MAQPMDIAWMVLKQEYMAPPVGSPSRLQYLASKGNLTPEEQAEFLALGGE